MDERVLERHPVRKRDHTRAMRARRRDEHLDVERLGDVLCDQRLALLREARVAAARQKDRLGDIRHRLAQVHAGLFDQSISLLFGQISLNH